MNTGTLEEKECLHRARATCLENIRNLNVWGNELHDISIIRQMINIEVLNLSVNNIFTLEDLSFCPRIKEVYLRRNKISSIEEIRFLKNLPNLQVLWLSDNACTNQENYLYTVLRNLPNLKKLDSHFVTQEQIETAKVEGTEISNETDLPVYDGLNLDETLTTEMLKCHLSNNACQEEKVKIPPAPSEEIDASSVEPKPVLCENGFSKESDYVKDPTSGNDHSNAETLSQNTQPSPRRSNTLSAIMLLLEELEENELLEVKQHADSLITSKYVKLATLQESVLVD